jgi:hypothetical protein
MPRTCQTRRTQNPVPARPCGLKCRPRYQRLELNRTLLDRPPVLALYERHNPAGLDVMLTTGMAPAWRVSIATQTASSTSWPLKRDCVRSARYPVDSTGRRWSSSSSSTTPGASRTRRRHGERNWSRWAILRVHHRGRERTRAAQGVKGVSCSLEP